MLAAGNKDTIERNRKAKAKELDSGKKPTTTGGLLLPDEVATAPPLVQIGMYTNPFYFDLYKPN